MRLFGFSFYCIFLFVLFLFFFFRYNSGKTEELVSSLVLGEETAKQRRKKNVPWLGCRVRDPECVGRR